MRGNVFDIKKFAVHDGPGIRSTLFLKGCPLACIWCHNPEGIRKKKNLWWFRQRCIGCGACTEACSLNALDKDEETGSIIIKRELCNNCGDCVEICPTKAMAFDGYELEAEDAVRQLLEDRIFYEQSGGGITISGGDPVFQSEFSRAVLESCKNEGLHTAIETSMYAKPEIMKTFIGLVDLFIVDIKIFDNKRHKEYTGTDNTLILSNFKMLAEAKQNMLVRIPLIPKITALDDNISLIAGFVADTAAEIPIELINFNPLSESKYRLMGKEYEFLTRMEPFAEEDLDRFYSIIESRGAKTERETSI